MFIIFEDMELEHRISKNLTKMKRNAKIEWLLEQFLHELWEMDEGFSKWHVQPMTKLDGKWISNPEYKRMLKAQKDILWKKLSNGSNQIPQISDKKIVMYLLNNNKMQTI